jgi:trehalose 6-phosphate phosphatase
MDHSNIASVEHRDADGETHSEPVPHFNLSEVAILLDVDGTILEIAPEPDLVHVPEGLCALLARLNAGVDGALALVSGRPIADLDKLFSPLTLAAIGGHGAEMRRGAGEAVIAQAPLLDARLQARLGELSRLGEGVIVENKGYSTAVHFRLAPHLGETLAYAVDDIVADFAQSGVEVLKGKAVLEVKSARVSKGRAFRELMMQPPFAARRPVFLGDDITDEAVFAELPEFAGYGISVGREIDSAEFVFADARDVRAWLASLAA